jgi:hypothetical protein
LIFEIDIHAEPFESHNSNNRIVLDGARKLCFRASAVGRNTRNCVKAVAWRIGCPYDAEKTVAITYIPDAVKRGTTMFANFRANKIEVTGTTKRVSGVVFDHQTQRPKKSF